MLESSNHKVFILEDEEAKNLLELKRRIGGANHDGKVGPEFAWMRAAKDYEYVRFLRGHGNNVSKALEMIKGTSQWKHENRIDELVRKCENPSMQDEATKFLLQYFPFLFISDQLKPADVERNTSPSFLCIYRMSMVDFKGLLNRFDLETIASVIVYQLEKAWRSKPQGNGIMIIDLGYQEEDEHTKPVQSIWDVTPFVSSLLTTTKYVSNEVDPNFPESFQKIYFTRVPTAFWASWKVAQFFVAERTRSKITITTSLSEIEHLKTHLPPFLGGTNETIKFPCAGKIIQKP